jgi:hemolysin III
MRRLDHSMIFLLIAGTYTPFALLLFHGPLATIILVVVWTGAVAGIGMAVLWPEAPKPITAAPYLALGWVAVAALPQLADRAGAVALGLVGAGGVLYTAGAAAYALQRPDPWPRVFGYHEVFHMLVVLAATCHYLAIAIYTGA